MTHTKKPGKQRRKNRAQITQPELDLGVPTGEEIARAKKKAYNKAYREKVKARKARKAFGVEFEGFKKVGESLVADTKKEEHYQEVVAKAKARQEAGFTKRKYTKRNTTGIKIEKGIPIPGSQKAYPFDRMKVGDSIFIKHPTSVSGKRVGRKACNAASNYSRSHEGKFTTRTVRGGTRIWRAE